MPLTPLDIHNKEFGRAFRGYREDEVDLFLDEIVREFESLLKENASLRERLETLSSKVEQYRELEDTLHNTLIIAQETAEDVKASARKEAELIVREAEQEAAETQRRAQSRLSELSDTYEELRKQMRLFRARLKSELSGQLELVEQHMRSSENNRSLEQLVDEVAVTEDTEDDSEKTIRIEKTEQDTQAAEEDSAASEQEQEA
jgi:cell division initiation protein